MTTTDPPPPWAAQMAAELVPDQPRAHEGHGFGERSAAVPAWGGWEPKIVVSPRWWFGQLSIAFASLSLIGDAVEWRAATAGKSKAEIRAEMARDRAARAKPGNGEAVNMYFDGKISALSWALHSSDEGNGRCEECAPCP